MSVATCTLYAGVALGLLSCGGRSHADHATAGPASGGASGASGAGGTTTLPAGGAGSGGASGAGAAGLAGQPPIPCKSAPGPIPEPREGGTLSTNALTTCVVVDGKVACFGLGKTGQLGDGVVHPDMDPMAGEIGWVTGLDDAVEVRVGSGFACARRSTGGVVCWGGNYSGQLGDGSLPASGTVVSGPVPVVGLADTEGLTVGAAHACALLAAGSVRCWGYGHFAQLGDGIAYGYPEGSGSAVPVDVLAPDGAIQLGVTQVAAGGAHSCALLSDHTVWCWGRAMAGELGDGSFHPGFEGSGISRDLVQVLDVDDAVQISAGGAQTCALRASGRVACWGHDGVASDTAQAVDVCGSEGTVQISAGDDHVCALLASGGVLCWGFGSLGNLGDGVEYLEHPTGSATPVSVIGLEDATEVAAGARQSCARTSAGKLYCWGDGSHGALGKGAVESSSVPLEIPGLDLKTPPP